MTEQLTNFDSRDRVDEMRVKPRVLFVVRFLRGYEGIAMGLVTLAQGLIESGWEVALASAMPKPTETHGKFTRRSDWFESYGIQYFHVPFPDLRTSPGNVIGVVQSLLKLSTAISQFHPDVINIHSLSVCPYIHAMRLVHKFPFVSTARIEPVSSRLSVKLGAWANRRFSNFLGDRFIAISTEIKNVYQYTLKVPEENIRLICHGANHEFFRPPSAEERFEARKAFQLDPKSKVVCLIGRLHPIKGHSLLFRAISILRSEGINPIVLCAGTGEWEDLIRLQATEAGVGDLVRLLGFVDARQVLWASDILTLPSQREGFGWVIPEAMLCGVVPIRTPAAGAFDQIEDGINGFVVPFDDPQALALRLVQVLENEKLRSQMSVAAINTARQKFTADRMTRDTICVYDELIATGQQPHLRS
jgi:glycosyltransferase involved in cell wall biosynthesis